MEYLNFFYLFGFLFIAWELISIHYLHDPFKFKSELWIPMLNTVNAIYLLWTIIGLFTPYWIFFGLLVLSSITRKGLETVVSSKNTQKLFVFDTIISCSILLSLILTVIHF